MGKPIVFFSHSASDKAPLSRLKELFVEKTGGAIEVFLSSDGQSIPFGRNWVHQVEEAMKRSELTVIFVSPAAVRSGWVYFEAGFSYSKGVKVVPVGFLGVDLSSLSPPLSLLQHFNITSHGSLNNLIAIANQQFGHKHAESFTRPEFEEIQTLGNVDGRSAVGNLSALIDEITVSLERKDLTLQKSELMPAVAKVFKTQKAHHNVYKSRLLAAGCVGFLKHNVEGVDENSFAFKFSVDPLNLPSLFPIVLAVLKAIAKEGVSPAWYFNVNPGVHVVRENFKVAARLKDKPVVFSSDDRFRFRDIEFEMGVFHPSKGYVQLRFCSPKVTAMDVADLFLVLEESKVLVKTGSPRVLTVNR